MTFSWVVILLLEMIFYSRNKNNETFCKYLLILSGDVELNPGPDFSCSICNKTTPLRYRVLCCYNCDSWVHKKCAKISEA